MDEQLQEKIDRLREIAEELREYDGAMFLWEEDMDIIASLKNEVFEIIETL